MNPLSHLVSSTIESQTFATTTQETLFALQEKNSFLNIHVVLHQKESKRTQNWCRFAIAQVETLQDLCNVFWNVGFRIQKH